MAGVITLLDQPRTLDALGRATDGIIFFYYSGTTVLAPIYNDVDLTDPAENPIELAAGEIFPDIFLNPSIAYRRRILYGDGSIHDVDPLPAEGTGAGSAKTPQDFGAVGDGITNDGPALQEWLNSGGDLLLPSGFDFSTQQLLLMSEEKTILKGAGTISVPHRIVGVAPDGTAAGVITVVANHCVIEGITISNPSQEKLSTGIASMGISTCANDTKISRCTVLDFENGITLSPCGEYYDWWVDECIVRVNGVGQLTPDNEDRGGGITGWGARMHITNNRVVPLAGTQCREGIFVEALADFAVDTSGLDFDTTSTIIGNHVGVADQTYPLSNPSVGVFRKGIDCEWVSRVVIANNIVRSFAWYGIQFAGGVQEGLVSNNAIFCDTPAGDTNGSIWGQACAAMHYYPNHSVVGRNIKFTNNEIYMVTAQARAFLANGVADSLCQDLMVNDNLVYASVDMGARAAFELVGFAAGTRISLAGNEVYGAFAYGIDSYSCPSVSVTGGIYDGQDTGFRVQISTKAIVKNVTFRNLDNGIETSAVTLCVADGNIFDTIATRCFINGGTTGLQATNNSCLQGGGLLGDFGTMTVSRWKGNIGFSYLTTTSTYDPASIAAGANGGVSSGVTLTGAQAGDRVLASWGAVTQGLVPSAAVSAANTVIGSFANPTAAPVDLASGTMTFKIERG